MSATGIDSGQTCCAALKRHEKQLVKSIVNANKEICDKLTIRFPNFFRSEGGHKNRLKESLDRVIASQHPKKILDVGSANRPILERSSEYTLTGLDIEELSGCDDIYDQFILQSIESPIDEKQNLIYSNAVLEHVPDNKAAANSMFGGLTPGGFMVHYLPCKNHPYALILRLVGKKLQKVIIRKLRPWASLSTTGYPTYFDYCSPGQMSKLWKTTGFTNIEVIPLYRANGYFKFFVPLFLLVTAFENFCSRFDIRYFCSGMIIIAEKPAATVPPTESS